MQSNSGNKQISCFHCKHDLKLASEDKISRREQCPHCSADLHCCSMCQFYDTTCYNDCREPMADRILEKEKANFCDYFILCEKNKDNAKQKDLLSAANALFKK
ncbi:MAG: hypothetical protein OXB84_08690 [Halobacteriovoraceae bacterium]|nr:hypothetical protein [Halobacteriovoraceae bacterium]